MDRPALTAALIEGPYPREGAVLKTTFAELLRFCSRNTPAVLSFVKTSKEDNMDNTTLLIIIVVLLLIGGGWYGRGRWY